MYVQLFKHFCALMAALGLRSQDVPHFVSMYSVVVCGLHSMGGALVLLEVVLGALPKLAWKLLGMLQQTRSTF